MLTLWSATWLVMARGPQSRAARAHAFEAARPIVRMRDKAKRHPQDKSHCPRECAGNGLVSVLLALGAGET